MKRMISIFCELGERLRNPRHKVKNKEIIKLAIQENCWFSESSITYAIESIVDNYLQKERLESWISRYNKPKHAHTRNIAVIMAGNIPLVGLFDMLSVLISGNKCLYKTSSKDRVLIEYVVSILKSIEPSILIEKLDDSKNVDAVIATGGDNAVRVFIDKYGDIPAIYRGSRFSVAVLAGSETEAEIELLAYDIFMHSGLGCRSVSMVFTPHNYNLKKLTISLKKYREIGDKYTNNYTQNRAIMELDGVEFLDGDFFTITKQSNQSHIISNINVISYGETEEVEEWIVSHQSEIQCVVSTIKSLPFQVGLGQAQKPKLNDFPDRIDTLKFLIN